MGVAFLYAGQGSQKAGMGKDFYEQHALARALYDGFLFSDKIKELSFYSDDTTLQETQHAQPVLLAYGMMVTKLLKEKGIEPDAVCGLSVGEYAALYAAKAISSRDALSLIFTRGRAMQDADATIPTAMYAVLIDDFNAVEKVVQEASTMREAAYISNYNTPKQVVISGHREAIQRAVAELKNKKIRSIPLRVSGAFHTPYMTPAKEVLYKKWQDIPWQEPSCPLYYNTTGTTQREGDLSTTMLAQMVQPVRFVQNIQNMEKDGITDCIEIGCGGVLTKMVQQTSPNLRMHTIDSYTAFEEVVKRL